MSNGPTKLFHYKGWFGFCPIYIDDWANEEPALNARSPLLEPLFWLSERMWALMFLMASFANPEYEPAWPIRITGELNPPKSFH